MSVIKETSHVTHFSETTKIEFFFQVGLVKIAQLFRNCVNME